MPRNKADHSRVATSRRTNYPFSGCTSTYQNWIEGGIEAPGGQRHIQQRFWLQEITFCLRVVTLGRTSLLLARCASRTKALMGWLSIPLVAGKPSSHLLSTPSLFLYLLFSLFPTEQRVGWEKAIIFHTLPQHKKQKELVGRVWTCKTEGFFHPGIHVRKTKCWA